MRLFLAVFFVLLLAAPTPAQDSTRFLIAGDAMLSHGAYETLSTMSDRFGPRMVGTPGHRASMDWLEAELVSLGLETRREPFDFPGWTRHTDTATLLEPVYRPLHAAALGYVGPHEAVEAPVRYVTRGDLEHLDMAALDGYVLALAPGLTFTGEEQDALAAAGVRGLLLTNRIAGAQLLTRVANRTGTPTPFPAFTITQEDGHWMQRALERGETVRVRLATTSEPSAMTGQNLIATLPGTSGQTVVVGAHFDSWDLGQGAIDNGLGVAQLYEAARLLALHSPTNRHTVEFVWFDAEEMGLWGSRRHVERRDVDDVRVMLNLDMVGEPSGLNAMGFDGLVPTLESLGEDLGAWSMTRTVANAPWLGSDHQPFIVAGVPAVTFYAPLDESASRYYHDAGDTLDKIDARSLARASALIALTTHALANDASPLPHLSAAETAAMLEEAGLEDALRTQGMWPFAE